MRFKVAGEAFDVGPASAEQADVVVAAPCDELAQVQGVGLAGQAAVTGEVRGKRVLLNIREDGVDEGDLGCLGGGHVAPPGQAETRRPERPDLSFVRGVNGRTIGRARPSWSAAAERPYRRLGVRFLR